MSAGRRDRYAVARKSVVYPGDPLSGELAVAFPSGCRWGIALSHDVDHLSLAEHLADGLLPRLALHALRKDLLRRFRPRRALASLACLAGAPFSGDAWAEAPERLLEAEARAGVKSSWFFAVHRGLGIGYSRDAAAAAVSRVLAAGHEVGLHSQRPDDGAGLEEEVGLLRALAERPVAGVRMHYLRLTPTVYDAAARAGLGYDSTVMDRARLGPEELALEGPRLVRPGLVEIPLHVMDSTLFSATGLAFDAAEATEYIARLAGRARAEGRVLVVNLHPNFYSRHSPEARAWYDALLGLATRHSDTWVPTLGELRQRILLP